MMKNRVLNAMAAIVIALTGVISMTGCSFDEIKESFTGETAKASEPVSNVCLVVSPTANQHKPDVSLAYNEIYDSCYSYGYKCCLVDDGKPHLAFEDDLTNVDRIDGSSDQNKKLDAEAYADDFIEKAEGVQALTAEKDTVKALNLAADALDSSKGDKTIVLIDNGISTTGIVSFTSFQNFDVDECISSLSENDFPDLNNVDVEWYGLGDTVAPQNELSNDDLVNLQSFWEKYLKNCGAANVKFPKKVAVNETADNSLLPWVSTVETSPIVSKVPDFKALMQQVEEMPVEERDKTFDDALKEGIKLEETSVKFHPGSSELIDRDTAIELMTPLADYMINNPERKIVLIGTTASYGTNDSCVGLSMERAETIKSILVNDMNVNSDQLISVGLGYENTFHIDDLNPDGTLNESVAPKNRCVIFADAYSDIGKQYM